MNAVSGTVTVDFYLRLWWQDNRFSMPIFWNAASSKLRRGFEVTKLLDNGAGLFQPDIRFHDVSALDYIAQVRKSIDIRNSG